MSVSWQQHTVSVFEISNEEEQVTGILQTPTIGCQFFAARFYSLSVDSDLA